MLQTNTGISYLINKKCLISLYLVHALKSKIIRNFQEGLTREYCSNSKKSAICAVCVEDRKIFWDKNHI